jgi:NAD(P)-dependent dehydrogenase (short-subunit alcohol dehydrogenase family)
LRSKSSIEKLFKKVGMVAGGICAAGSVGFGNVTEIKDADLVAGINNKLIGQVNLVRVALAYLNPKGFITLTGGMLAQEPWPSTLPAAMVDAALEGFVRAAALDVGRGIRINVVSPIFINITAKKMGLSTTGTMTAEETAKAYQASILGDMTGQIIDVRDYGIPEGSKTDASDIWELLNVA